LILFDIKTNGISQGMGSFSGMGICMDLWVQGSKPIGGKKMRVLERRVFIREDGTNYLGGMFDVEDIRGQVVLPMFLPEKGAFNLGCIKPVLI
jgi:hypothetical protein